MLVMTNSECKGYDDKWGVITIEFESKDSFAYCKIYVWIRRNFGISIWNLTTYFSTVNFFRLEESSGFLSNVREEIHVRAKRFLFDSAKKHDRRSKRDQIASILHYYLFKFPSVECHREQTFARVVKWLYSNAHIFLVIFFLCFISSISWFLIKYDFSYIC